MPGAPWDDVWQEAARAVARRSSCARGQVGAVVVDARQRLVSSGYNGPPAGIGTAGCRREQFYATAESTRGWLELDRPPCDAVHAEANALLWGDRREREGGTIYVTRCPCRACALLIANSGLARVRWERCEDADKYVAEASDVFERTGIDYEETG